MAVPQDGARPLGRRRPARHGRHATSPPSAIVGGSHDPLLEWALRESGCGLASLPEGSEAGCRRLARGEVAVAAIHMHRDRRRRRTANADAVAIAAGLHDAVLIAFVRREQGLMVPPAIRRAIGALDDALARGLRFGLRQKGAGAQLLLGPAAPRRGRRRRAGRRGQVYPTGADIAQAVRSGRVDCGIATRAVADGAGLGFIPLAWERFDLAMRHRTYFEPGPQALFAFMRTPALARPAAALGGYDATEAGRVRINR